MKRSDFDHNVEVIRNYLNDHPEQKYPEKINNALYEIFKSSKFENTNTDDMDAAQMAQVLTNLISGDFPKSEE